MEVISYDPSSQLVSTTGHLPGLELQEEAKDWGEQEELEQSGLRLRVAPGSLLLQCSCFIRLCPSNMVTFTFEYPRGGSSRLLATTSNIWRRFPHDCLTGEQRDRRRLEYPLRCSEELVTFMCNWFGLSDNFLTLKSNLSHTPSDVWVLVTRCVRSNEKTRKCDIHTILCCFSFRDETTWV